MLKGASLGKITPSMMQYAFKTEEELECFLNSKHCILPIRLGGETIGFIQAGSIKYFAPNNEFFGDVILKNPISIDQWDKLNKEVSIFKIYTGKRKEFKLICNII